MNPVAFTIGGLSFRWYSLLIVIGLLIGYIGVMLEADRFSISRNFIVNNLFWAVILGIIGARFYYVVFNWDYYSLHVDEIFKIWNGGLAIHGGLIFGTLSIILYSKKYNISTFKVLDIFAPFMILAQAIGRWGNFFNKEAYGTITTYARLKELHIPEFVIKGMYIDGNYYLPMFLFESLWCLLGFIFLLIMRRVNKIKKGQLTGLYLMWYSFGRFFIERYRTDSLLLGNLRMAQIISIVLFIVGFTILIIVSFKKSEDNLYNSSEKNNLRY